MTQTFELVLNEALSLSEAERARLISILSRSSARASESKDRRMEKIRDFQKRFRGVLPSTEEFMAEKRKEVHLED
jgi:archaellum biogenesis protein FlaJ (TadC family)